MWYKDFFKPKSKLTLTTPVTEPVVVEGSPELDLKRVVALLDVDVIMANPAYKRLLIKTYTLDVAQLLSSIYTGAKTSSSETAVSLYDYFRVTQLPTSECISRLITGVTSNKTTTTVRRDVAAIVSAFDEIAFLMNERNTK